MATLITPKNIASFLSVPIVLGLIVLVIITNAFQPVEAGTVKVIKRFDGTTGKDLHPGPN